MSVSGLILCDGCRREAPIPLPHVDGRAVSAARRDLAEQYGWQSSYVRASSCSLRDFCPACKTAVQERKQHT